MQQITVPGTGLVTSRLGFGTASLHHLLKPSDRQLLLRAALDNGFTHFDTARMYGDGMAERALGDCFDGGLRQRVTLACKFGIPANPLLEHLPWLMYTQRAMGSLGRRVGFQPQSVRGRSFSVAAAEASLNRSLNALRTEWLDVLFVHEPQVDDLPALLNLTEWLLRLKSSGRVRYLGLAGQADATLAIHQAMLGVFDILQVEDSIVGREADALASAGLPLQVTYGYLRLAGRQPQQPDLNTHGTSEILNAALARNSDGMVLVSTRKSRRVRDLADLAQ